MSNNAEFDLELFVDMFDTALASDNPTVKKCFNNLLMVVSLVHAEDKDDQLIGPLRKLVNDVENLTSRIICIENIIANKFDTSGPTGSTPIYCAAPLGSTMHYINNFKPATM